MLKNIIDEIDRDLLSKYHWYNHTHRLYVRTSITDYDSEKIPGKRRRRKWLHLSRMVLSRKLGRELKPFEVADHINGICFDNRRDNLRVADAQQNAANKKVHVKNKTGYRGVTISPNGEFRASIFNQGKRFHLGFFKTVTEAAAAYNQAAQLLHGEYSGIHRDHLPS